MQFAKVQFSASTVGRDTKQAGNANCFWGFVEDFDD
jgi:hypothetical protein